MCVWLGWVSWVWSSSRERREVGSLGVAYVAHCQSMVLVLLVILCIWLGGYGHTVIDRRTLGLRRRGTSLLFWGTSLVCVSIGRYVGIALSLQACYVDIPAEQKITPISIVERTCVSQ